MDEQGELVQGEEATKEEIGKRVAEARKIAGYSQAELGDLLGVSKRAVQTYEAGITVPFRHFARLAELTNRSIGWFLHGEEDGHQGADVMALARVLTEELQRHDRSMEKRSGELAAELRANSGVLAEIRDSLAQLITALTPAAAAIAAAIASGGFDPGNLPGLGG